MTSRVTHPGTRRYSPPVGVKAEVVTGQAGAGLAVKAPDWAAGGARCLDADPEQFHPIGHTTQADQDQARATIARYCQPCPMVTECGEWAAKAGKKQGIWGAAWLDGPKDMRERRAS